jgi:hypothetical protein
VKESILNTSELTYTDDIDQILEDKIIEESMLAEQKNYHENYTYYKNLKREEVNKQIEQD